MADLFARHAASGVTKLISTVPLSPHFIRNYQTVVTYCYVSFKYDIRHQSLAEVTPVKYERDSTDLIIASTKSYLPLTQKIANESWITPTYYIPHGTWCIYCSLKRKFNHFNELFINGCTVSYQTDNFQLEKLYQDNNIILRNGLWLLRCHLGVVWRVCMCVVVVVVF